MFIGSANDQYSFPTCGQFLAMIDEHGAKENLTEENLKELCFSKLSNEIKEFVSVSFSDEWTNVKKTLMENFSIKLSIKEKVDVLQKLQQQSDESVDRFYERCILTQYLVSDDVRDVTFDREVLLHFLMGLHPIVRDIVLAAECSSLENFVLEAKKVNLKIKEEVIAPMDVKVEMTTNDNVEDDENDNELYNKEDVRTDMNDRHESTLGDQMYYDDDVGYYQGYVDSNIKNVKEEISQISEKPAPQYKCQKCTKYFRTRKRLKLHVINKHGENAKKSGYKCKFDCDLYFKTTIAKAEHELNEHKDGHKVCEFCKESFPGLKALASHITYNHCKINDDGKTVCILCNSFLRVHKHAVKAHIMVTHFNCPDHKCSYCGRGFLAVSEMKSHIQTQHVHQRYHCDKCAKIFKSITGLKRHIEIAHGEQKFIQCDQCDKTFTNDIVYKSHKKKHNAKPVETAFVCDLCGKSYKTKGNLKVHCISEHSTPQEKAKYVVKCEYPDCNFTGLARNQVKRHVEIVHLKVKKFECAHCQKGFYKKDSLEEHTNGVHLNIKNLECDVCDFATAYTSTLKEHKKVAHGNQKFDCKLIIFLSITAFVWTLTFLFPSISGPFCQHSARYKGNLDKHINSVHKNIVGPR